MARYGRDQPKGRLVIGRTANARLGPHIPHSVVDGLHGSREGERSDSPRHHLPHIPFGEKVSGEVVIPVKLFDINDLRSNGTHLKEIQHSPAQSPLHVHFSSEDGPHFLPSLVEQFYLLLGKEVIGTGPIALTGNLVATGRYLPGNQVLSLPLHRLDEDVGALAGIGRKENARLLAVYHLLHHKIHPAPGQLKMSGIVPYAVRIQGREALLDAFQKMGTVYEQAGFVLSGVGGLGPVFIGGR